MNKTQSKSPQAHSNYPIKRSPDKLKLASQVNNSPSKFGLIATSEIIAEYPSNDSTQYLQSYGQNMFNSKQSFNKNNYSYL